MKTIYLLLTLSIFPALHPLTAQETNNPKKLLSDALFAEEANQDLPTALTKYQAVLDQYDQHRTAAGLALFRLAEINLKQGNQQKAITLYKRLLTEFPNLKPHTNTAKKQLLALNQKLPTTPNNTPDPEAQELARLKKLATTSPDILHKPETLDNAAKNGWRTVLQFLIDHKAPLNHGATSEALGLAALNGHSTACELLLKNGIDPTLGDNSLAIAYALSENHLHTLKILLNSGATKIFSGKFPDAEHEIFSSFYDRPSLSTLKLLIKAGFARNKGNSKTDKSNKLAYLLLNEAVVINRLDLVSYLISIFPASYIPLDDNQLLHTAILTGNSQILSSLLSAYPHILNNDPYPKAHDTKNRPVTPLSVVIATNKPNVLKTLLKAGMKIPKGTLTRAAEYGHIPTIKVLLEHGQKIDEFDVDGNSPMKQASLYKHPELLKFFLKNGAEISPTTFPHFTKSQREKWFRDTYYPKLQNQNAISLAMPDLNWHTVISKSELTKESLALALYLTNLPQAVFTYTNTGKSWVFASPNLNFSIIRQGQSIPLDFDKPNVPNLKLGDIIELTGFIESETAKKFTTERWLNYYLISQPGKASDKTLAHLDPTPTTIAIKKHISFPIKITTPTKTQTFILKGKLLTFDPRTNEVPLGPLENTLNLIGHWPTQLEGESVIIKRSNKESISLQRNQKQPFHLKPNDELIVSDFTLSPYDSIIITDDKNSFNIQIPGSDPKSNPTLFQALTHANKGANFKDLKSTPYLSDNTEKFVSADYLQILNHPKKILNRLHFRGWSQPVLPNIDYSKINIIKAETGNTISIDVEKIIQTWNGTNASAQQADLQLDRGDKIIVTLKPGKAEDQTETQQAFFKAALNKHFTRVTEEGLTVASLTLNYTPPKWISSDSGPIPMQASTKSKGSQLASSVVGYGTCTIKKGENTDFVTYSHNYWPKDGDRFSMKK